MADVAISPGVVCCKPQIWSLVSAWTIGGFPAFRRRTALGPRISAANTWRVIQQTCYRAAGNILSAASGLGRSCRCRIRLGSPCGGFRQPTGRTSCRWSNQSGAGAPLVHCIRAYTQCRMMVGLRCTTDERITRFRGYIKKYEKFCSRVSEEYGKSFDFPKQHATAHVIDDLREKGTMNHHTTRLGEGFHQEVKAAYAQTNGKNEDSQLARLDENHEAIALIRMRLIATADPGSSEDHWSCGASFTWTTSNVLEHEMRGNRFYTNFDAKLRKLMADEQSERFGDTVKICRHRCLYLNYQSTENWTEARDILRCSPKFHGQERHNFALVNMTGPGTNLTCAHILGLFTCKSLDGTSHDVALVSMLKPSSWKPNTVWDGCRVYEEPKQTQLIFVKYLIRGVYMCPVFDSKRDNLVYLLDTVDYDMFLRAGN
ncbi:hypothetical protein DFH09DRAFT_1212316 [Mycena vulgaris]|nr:hypothetical protein DFH09DRAFT_1212316 [Mycena vulgaris]